MTFKPNGDRLLVEPIIESNETASGIAIVRNEVPRPVEGIVIAKGDGHWEDGNYCPIPFAVGDHILFSKYGVTELKIDGKDVLLLKADDIFGVITKEEPLATS